jgi:hypothetical protein
MDVPARVVRGGRGGRAHSGGGTGVGRGWQDAGHGLGHDERRRELLDSAVGADRHRRPDRELALVYASGADNGYFGYGWGLA